MNGFISIGIFIAVTGGLVVAAMMLAARASGRRRQQLVGSDDPITPVNLASVNDAVIAARLGGRVTFVNDVAREWFGVEDMEPDLLHLAQAVNQADAFLELFAAEGQANFSLGSRDVEATSHRVATGESAQFIVVLHEAPPLPSLNREDRGSAQAMKVLSNVVHSINASLTLEPTLQATLEGAQRLVQHDSAQIYLWDTEREVLRAVARSTGGDYEPLHPDEAPTYRRDQGYPGWIARKRQPLLNADTRQTDKLARTGPLVDPLVASYLGVPLSISSRFVGVLELTATATNAFDDDDQALLVLLAEQAASAIENARAYHSQAERVEELTGLQRVAESISVLQDPERLFGQLGQRVAELMGTEMAGVLLYDREHQRLVAQRPFYGMLDTMASRYIIPLRRGSPARSVWEDVSYWFSNNVPDDHLVREMQLTELVRMTGTRTLAMVQMTVGDERSGVLQVANKLDGTVFNMEDIRQLQTYASQAAIVVESARLYAQEQTRVAELEGLQQIVQTMSAFTNPEELYAQLTQRIAELLGVNICGILIYEPEEEKLTARAPFYGMTHDMAAEYTIPVRRGLAREIWRDHELYLSNSVFTDETIDLMGLRELVRSAGLSTVMLAPLSAGGRRFGMLQVSNKLDGTDFDESDERLVKIFAGQAAALVENARLYQDTDSTLRKRAAELRSVARVSHKLNATLELERILEAIAAEAQRADGARWASLIMFDPAMIYGTALSGATRKLAEVCTRTGDTLVIDDFEKQNQYTPPVRGARSALVVPVRFEGQIVGAIGLYGERPHALGDSAIEYVQALASQTTSAVTNATRHAEQVRRAEQLSKSLRDLEVSYTELDKLSQEMMRKDVELSQANDLLNIRAARLLALHRIMESVDTTRHPEGVLESIAGSVVEEMDIEQCVIALKDDEQPGGLRLVTAAGDIRTGFDFTSLAISHTPIATARDEQQAVVYDYSTRPEKGAALLADALGAVTYVALPMPFEDGGVMIVGSTRSGMSFGEDDRDLFALLASQVVVEYENARLYKAVQDEATAASSDRDRLQQLHLITTALQQTRSLESRLAIIARGMRSVGWSKVAVMLLNDDGSIDELVTAGYTDDEMDLLHKTLLPGDIWTHRFDDPVFSTLNLGTGYYLPHDDEWVIKNIPAISQLEGPPHEGGWHPADQVYLPMYAGTDVIGVINLREPDDGQKPTESSLRPIELFIQQSASALENTRLYQATLALQSYNEAVVQSIQQGIVVTNSEGVIETINSFIRDQYGWDDSFIGKSLANDDPALWSLGLGEHVQQVIETGERVEQTNVLYPAGGEVRYLNIYIYPRYDEAHQLTGAVILLEDVSQRVRLEADIALRGRQLAALNNVSRNITSALSVGDVVQTTLEEAKAVLKFDQIEMWLHGGPDGKGSIHQLRLAGSRGPDGTTSGGLIVEVEAVPEFAQIAQDNKPLIPEQHPAARDGSAGRQSRSWMGVPMISGGEMLGIMVFEKNEAHAYAPADGQVASALANQAAVVLENARLFEEAADRAEALHSRTERLALLNRISSTLGSSLDQNSILQTASDELRQAIGVDQASVIIFDDVRAIGKVEIQSPSKPDGSVDQLTITLDDNPAINHLLQTRMPLAIEKVAGNELLSAMRDVFEQRGIQSSMLVPIIIGNTLIGMMTLDATSGPRHFEAEQIELTQTITNQVAISVQNAQLFMETVARQRELSILSEASRVMASSLDMHTVAANAATYFMRSLEVDGCAVSLLEEDGGLLTLVEQTRGGEPVIPTEQREITGLPSVQRVVDEQEGMVIRAVTAELGSSHAKWLRTRGVTSMMVLPLLSRDEVIGLIELWHNQPNHPFDDRATRTGRALAASVATALENARLHDQTEARLVELGALNELSRALTQIISVEDLYSLLPHQLNKVLGIRSLTLALRDPETGRLSIPLDVQDGQRSEEALDSTGLYEQVLDSGEPLLLSRSAASRLREMGYDHQQPELKSFLAVPFASGPMAGVLAFKDLEQDGTLDEASLRVLNPLATQVAVTIENARLYNELEQRLSETTTLQEVSRVVNSALDLQEIFDRVVRELAQAFNYPLIGLYTREGQRLTLQAHQGYTAEEATHFTNVPLGSNITGKAAATGQAIFLRDITEGTDYLPSHPWITNEIAVPIIADEDVLGVLMVASGDDNPLDDNDLTLLQTFAGQVSTAMANAGLYTQMVTLSEELERRVEERTRELRDERDRIDTLYRIAVELTASLDLDMVLSRAMELVGEAVGASNGVLFLVDPHSDKLIHRASMHTETPLPPGGRHVELSRDEGLAGWVMENRQSVIINDVRTDPRWVQISGTEALRSALATPLIANDVVLGCIFFNSDETDTFNEGHLRLVEASANQVAGSINNAELYRMIREQAERLGVMLRSQQTEAAKSQAILESVADGVMVTDQTGEVILFNAAAERTLGLRRDQALGRPTSDLSGLYGAGGDRWTEAIETWRTDPRNYDGQFLSEQIEVEDRIISVHVSPVLHGREYLGLVSVFRDITREVMADRIKSEFVARVSHELRTPMTSIKGYADLLLMGAAGEVSPEQRHFLDTIKNNADRLSLLVNDLLDISRIEQGHIDLDIKSIDLSMLIGEVLDSFKGRMSQEERHLTLSADIPMDAPPIEADYARVVQVLTNLISNAYQYTPDQGSITVRVRPNEKGVQIDVVDTGIGIAKADQDHVFERFFRGEGHPLVFKTAGTGLGLSIVQQIVEMHNGRVWLESEEGAGSTFSVWLPRVFEGAVPQAPYL